MINVDLEIERLRNTLTFRGLSHDEASHVCGLAKSDIDSVIEEIVDETMQDAIDIGTRLGIDEFVQQLEIKDNMGIPTIGTSSGKTDFSKPPYPMLPHLLKNAKVAKDGSRYQRIPIAKKGSAVNSIFDQQQGVADTQKAKLTELREQRKANRTKFSGLAEASQFLSKKFDNGDKFERKADVDIKTASSKQDASTQWVHPGKDFDMERVIFDLNSSMHISINEAINEIIRSYESLV